RNAQPSRASDQRTGRQGAASPRTLLFGGAHYERSWRDSGHRRIASLSDSHCRGDSLALASSGADQVELQRRGEYRCSWSLLETISPKAEGVAVTGDAQSGSRLFCTVWRDALAAVLSQLGLASPAVTVGTLSVATTINPEERASKIP